nr:solute carrier family 49 member A3-like [Hydra vulgaris]
MSSESTIHNCEDLVIKSKFEETSPLLSIKKHLGYQRWVIIGLRSVLVLASVLSVLGTGFHLAGFCQNGFKLFITGQIFAALGNSAILQMPSQLSSQWFPNNERGKSTAIGCFTNMVGGTLGFLQNTFMITEYNNFDKLKNQFRMFYLTRFVFVIITFLLTLIFFKNPPLHDSQYYASPSQNFIKKGKSKKYLIMLLTDKHFLVMSQSYSIYFGLIAAIPLILDLFMSKYKNKLAENVGWMGVFNLICGTIGCIVFGILLDKIKKFRALAIVINFSATMTWLAFILTLKNIDNFFGPFVMFLIYGFFAYPYLTIGLEQSAEMTFPVPEEFSSTFILIIANLYSLIFSLVFGVFFQLGLVATVPYTITGFYLLSTFLTCVVKTYLKRNSAEISLAFNSRCN